MKETFNEIDRQAAEWAARRDAAALPVAEQAAFDAWLTADSRHLGAYARAEAVLATLERVGAAGADHLRLVVASPARLTRRVVVWGGSIAAALVAGALGADPLLRFFTQKTYATGIGETRVVPLSDGSVITLNTNSRVVVDYKRDSRVIGLAYGEVLFDVAKDKVRPFLVNAADTEVRAVGTSFTVKLLPNQPLRVLVQEGTVEVRRPDNVQARPVRVSMNGEAIARPSASIEAKTVQPAQVKRDLAWRLGRIAFDNVTLKDAADEFARYSDIHLLVDPEISDQSITGLFVSNDPVGFARATAASLNLHAEIGDREVRLSR